MYNNMNKKLIGIIISCMLVVGIVGCTSSESTVEEEDQVTQEKQVVKKEEKVKSEEELIKDCLGDIVIDKVEKSNWENSDGEKQISFSIPLEYTNQTKEEMLKTSKELINKIENELPDIKFTKLLFSYEVVVDGVEFTQPVKYIVNYSDNDITIDELFCSIDGVNEFNPSTIEQDVANKDVIEANKNSKIWVDDVTVIGFLFNGDELYANLVHTSEDCWFVKRNLKKETDLTVVVDKLSSFKKLYPNAKIDDCGYSLPSEVKGLKLSEIGIHY